MGVQLPHGESRGADPYARILRKEPGKKSRQGEYRGVLAAPAAARLPALDIPYEDCLFYKTHVRGFTMRRGSSRSTGEPSGASGR